LLLLAAPQALDQHFFMFIAAFKSLSINKTKSGFSQEQKLEFKMKSIDGSIIVIFNR
jgi:hypothetical protein